MCLYKPLFQLFGKFVNLDEALQVQHFLVILLPLAVHPADDGGNVTEDGRVHQGPDEHDDD